VCSSDLTTKPIAPNNIISVAAVLSSGANGILLIRPQIGSNINNDEGVKITTPTTGDILQLQASGLWENKSLAGAGFLSGSGTTNYLAKFTASGTVGDSVVFDNGTNVGIGTDSPSLLFSVLNKVGIDNVPPRIYNPNFIENSNISKLKTLSVSINDVLSGIDSYNAYLNDEWILMEYDYKTKKLIHNFEDGKVIPGNNTIKIVVTDKLDNTATFTSNFIY
jgi:hypothetical protein